jgi:hypothetical protein
MQRIHVFSQRRSLIQNVLPYLGVQMRKHAFAYGDLVRLAVSIQRYGTEEVEQVKHLVIPKVDLEKSALIHKELVHRESILDLMLEDKVMIKVRAIVRYQSQLFAHMETLLQITHKLVQSAHTVVVRIVLFMVGFPMA